MRLMLASTIALTKPTRTVAESCEHHSAWPRATPTQEDVRRVVVGWPDNGQYHLGEIGAVEDLRVESRFGQDDHLRVFSMRASVLLEQASFSM